MRKQAIDQLLIVAATSVICFTCLGGAALWDEDEPLYASCAWEMLQRNDWVVPYYNGQMFPDKPPLMFWMMMSGYEIFGRTEFAVRFWSAVAALGTALATYHLGRMLFRREVGLWAGLIVCSSFIFTISARAATVDSALTLATTLGFLAFVAGGMAKRRGLGGDSVVEHPDSPQRLWFLPRSWIIFLIVWVMMGIAVLAKGPVGLLLPMASIGLFVMLMNYGELPAGVQPGTLFGRMKNRLIGVYRALGPGNFFRSLWQLKPLTGVVVVLAVAGPWFVMVGLRDDQWLAQFFGKFNWRPFTEPILGHSGPCWYHVPAILIGFFPWSIFMVPVLMDWAKGLRRDSAWRVGYLLLGCWLGVFFVFWSICKTKLPHYLLPAYPALSLATACFVYHWVLDPSRLNRWWMRVAFGITIVVGLGIAVGFPIAARIYAPGEELLGLLGLILVVGGGASMYLAEHRRPAAVMTVYATMSVILVTAVFGVGTLRIDRYQYARGLMAEVAEHGGGPRELVGYRYIRESVVYYAGQPVQYVEDADQLRKVVEEADNPYVLTTEEHEAEFESQFPGEFSVVSRRDRFLTSGQIVVFARRTPSPTPHTAARMAESPER